MFASTLLLLIMNWDVPGIIRKLRSYWRMKKMLEGIRFHTGRTDGDGGHRDLKNASGLGYYHYHHGLGPHLHPCPYGQEKRASLVTLLKKNGAVLSTANIGTADEPKYLFEAVIEVYPNALWLKLQFGAKNQYVDGFYLYGYTPKTLVEPFWGTALNPELVIVNNSPWKGATGYIDILVYEAYFYTTIEKLLGVSAPENDCTLISSWLWLYKNPTSSEIGRVVEIPFKDEIGQEKRDNWFSFENKFDINRRVRIELENIGYDPVSTSGKR